MLCTRPGCPGPTRTVGHAGARTTWRDTRGTLPLIYIHSTSALHYAITPPSLQTIGLDRVSHRANMMDELPKNCQPPSPNSLSIYGPMSPFRGHNRCDAKSLRHLAALAIWMLSIAEPSTMLMSRTPLRAVDKEVTGGK